MASEITGLDEMRARLKELEASIREEYIAKAVKAGADVIRDAMRADAPMHDKTNAGSDALPPGALRDDIKARQRMDKDGFAVSIIGPGKKTAYVARFVEYGHRLVKGKQEVGQVPAHPFLRPAFERIKAESIEEFKKVLREEIAGGLK